MSTNQQLHPGPGPLWTALVDRVAAGDPDAIQALFASFAGLKGYFCRRIGSEDAEDMFHELIVVLIQQIQKGVLEDPERLPGYVYAIAQRHVAAQIRLRMRSRRTCSVDDVKLTNQATDTETSLGRKELRTIAQRVLKSMPVQQRDVLIRFYVQEQRPEEIREAFGITETQIRLLKSRSKARFAELCRKAIEPRPVRSEPRGRASSAEVAQR